MRNRKAGLLKLLKMKSRGLRDLRDFRKGLAIAQRHIRNLAFVFVVYSIVYSIFKWVLSRTSIHLTSESWSNSFAT